MAISVPSYSVGNRVYNGGSSAPTRGTVDPMGYVNRELNKPSQTRSGLAEAALAQLKNLQPGQAPGDSEPMAAPLLAGTPPMQQRQLTVTPSGRHVFMDMIPTNAGFNPLQQAAQQMLVQAHSGPMGQVQ